MNYLIIYNFNDLILNRLYHRAQGDCAIAIVSSYLRNLGNTVNTINMIGKKINEIPVNNFDEIIIRVTEDNIFSIIRMIPRIFLHHKKIFLLSFNENISEYLSDELLKSYVNFEERKNLFCNLISLNKVLNLDLTDEEVRNKIGLLETSNSEVNRMSLLVGIGCSNSCAFCSISNTPIEYFSLISIIKNIKKNIESGVKSFHISNHSFCSNANYVKKFCNLLMKECGHLDFKWSCFLIPKNILTNLNILTILKDSKLDRVEIGVENINKEIQADFNLDFSEKEIFSIINKCQEIGISSIVVNYILGSPLESNETLVKSDQFIENITLKTYGIVDFNFYFFYPYLKTKYRNDKDLKNHSFSLTRCAGQKLSIAQSSFFLSSEEIYNFKIKMMTKLYNLRCDLFHKLHPAQRINNMFLSDYNIITQAWQFYQLSSISSFTELTKSYERYYFLKDVIKNAAHFTALFFRSPYISEEGRYRLYVDPLFSDTQNKFIDISDFNLYHSLIAKKTIAEIFTSNTIGEKNPQKTIQAICEKFEALENAHLITYEKVLN